MADQVEAVIGLVHLGCSMRAEPGKQVYMCMCVHPLATNIGPVVAGLDLFRRPVIYMQTRPFMQCHVHTT